MARKKTNEPAGEAKIADYRYDDSKRKNIPPAGLAAQGKVADSNRIEYAYNPHLPPVLRSDPAGDADKLPELLEIARTRALTADEARMLAAALKSQEPWLEWSGKREQRGFAVDPVALHIHERISAQAITKIAARQDVQRDLFADPQLDYQKAVQFYQHDVDWANRMILGDSLQVMASLARREDVAGKVQMIYMDPPYGIKFASNFQPEIGKRDVKDKEADLTREPEMVRAYRDTWTLGVHSYLAYLRDRLILAKDLLTDSGSIFVQISDENLHRVRMIMDEVFGIENFCNVIPFKKTGGQSSKGLPSVADYLLWYCKSSDKFKFRQLYLDKEPGEEGATNYNWIEEDSGARRTLTSSEQLQGLQKEEKVFQAYPMFSEGPSSNDREFSWHGITFRPSANSHWKTTADGLNRLASAERLLSQGKTLRFVNYLADYPSTPITNIWTDTQISGFAEQRMYVVQTLPKVIQRCLLMTSDPGDLVLDPTCGGGTTALVAEQWGRRWITIDTSRVALSLARQRLMTASFQFYKVNSTGSEDTANPATGFAYKTVPHITLKSIAQNAALDPIFAKHQAILDEKLNDLNAALKKVPQEVRDNLSRKLMEKEKREGKKSLTDADRRRLVLPKEAWQEWEVPFDTDPEWPKPLSDALDSYRTAWRAKMDEVNACIEANATPEDLVDQPEPVKGIARVSGPFTMEAVMPVAESLECDSPIVGAPEELETFGDSGSVCVPQGASDPVNAEAYLDRMLHLLRTDGVRFPNNKSMKFSRLEQYNGDYLHAEGEWANGDGITRTVAVSFGPQFGPVTAFQVENALPTASRRGFDELVFAGFSFDAAAQAIIQDDPNPRVRCHLAHIRPDVNMGDLLKETPNSQLFTVFGSPRTTLDTGKDGMYTIRMEGVDIYNPVENTIIPTNADKVAAWFLDTDYDGSTFCITQAFFPDRGAWDKLAKAMKGVIDEERFAALSGTTSLPFPSGKYKRVAVKVIDPRGNEVLKVHRLGNKEAGYDLH